MKVWVLAATLVLSGWAAGAEEVKLDDAAISAALSGKSLTYEDGATQAFKADGATVYDNGKPSTGQWRVQGGRYCSVWPPSDRWACYDVMRGADGKTIAFVADDGSRSLGVVAP